VLEEVVKILELRPSSTMYRAGLDRPNFNYQRLDLGGLPGRPTHPNVVKEAMAAALDHVAHARKVLVLVSTKSIVRQLVALLRELQLRSTPTGATPPARRAFMFHALDAKRNMTRQVQEDERHAWRTAAEDATSGLGPSVMIATGASMERGLNELGIDAVVLLGYAMTEVSLFQRLGRLWRDDNTTPCDAVVVSHPVLVTPSRTCWTSGRAQRRHRTSSWSSISSTGTRSSACVAWRSGGWVRGTTRQQGAASAAPSATRRFDARLPPRALPRTLPWRAERCSSGLGSLPRSVGARP